MEGEFEQIIMKRRLSFKENNNQLQSKFHWLLFEFSGKFQDRILIPYKHCNFTFSSSVIVI